jgi:HlyD family secretion protein
MPEEPVQKHPLTLAVLLVIVISAVAGAIYMMRRADARAHADEPAVRASVPVEVQEVHEVDVPVLIEARGFLQGFEEVIVHSEVAGRVHSREAEDGDTVRSGDVLLRIDDTFYALRRRQAQAELAGAQARLTEAKAHVRQAEAQLRSGQASEANKGDEFARINKLYESGNSPQIEFDRVETALRIAEFELAAADAALARALGQQAIAEATLATAQAALGEAEAHLERCVVRSPISGRVNQFLVEVGEYAVNTAPLVEIVRLDRMKMIVELTGQEVVLLDRFSGAEVTADVTSDRTHQAVLHHVAPKVDPVSKKFRVELHVENEDESFLAGMYGTVALECGHLSGILPIAREAVFKHYGADFCLVVEEGDGGDTARLRRVEIRELAGCIDEVQAISGLAPGDWVITTRRPELGDNVPVAVNRRELADEH